MQVMTGFMPFIPLRFCRCLHLNMLYCALYGAGLAPTSRSYPQHVIRIRTVQIVDKSTRSSLQNSPWYSTPNNFTCCDPTRSSRCCLQYSHLGFHTCHLLRTHLFERSPHTFHCALVSRSGFTHQGKPFSTCYIPDKFDI